jgi:hypothetical protein
LRKWREIGRRHLVNVMLRKIRGIKMEKMKQTKRKYNKQTKSD